MILIWFASLAFGRDVCKTVKLEVDAFDANVSTIAGYGHAIRRTETGTAFEIRFTEKAFSDRPIRAAFPLQMKLTDGSVVTLYSVGVASAHPNALGTEWNVSFPITREVAHAVAGSAPVAFQYAILDERTHDISKAWQRTYQRKFACAANRWDAKP